MNEIEKALVRTRLVGLEGGKTADASIFSVSANKYDESTECGIPMFAAANCAYVHAVGGTMLWDYEVAQFAILGVSRRFALTQQRG